METPHCYLRAQLPTLMKVYTHLPVQIYTTCTVAIHNSISTPPIGRYWKTVEKLKLTHFYTLPSVLKELRIRANKAGAGVGLVEKYDLSSLKVIATGQLHMYKGSIRLHFLGPLQVVSRFLQTWRSGSIQRLAWENAFSLTIGDKQVVYTKNITSFIYLYSL